MALCAASGSVDITPPVGLDLSGWCFGPSTGVADPLYARALVLHDDGEPLVVIAADLIGLGTAYADELRSRIASRLSSRPDRVLISCSHTHSGPGTMPLRRWGPIDEAYVGSLLGKLEDLAVTTSASVEPAVIRSARTEVPGLSENRRKDRGDLTDDEVPVVVIDDQHGHPLAILYSVSCHPVAAHGDRNLISADFPGYAARTIQEAFPNAQPLFLLGAAGDINPVAFHELRLAEQYGSRAGGAVVAAAREASPAASQTVATASARVQLPVAALPSAHELEQESRKWTDEAARLGREQGTHAKQEDALIKAEWADEALGVVRDGSAASSVEMEISGVRVGDTAVIAMPAEPFVAIGMEIRRRSPFASLAVSGLSNGSLCYIPTADAYEAGGYETDFSAKVYGLYMLTQEAEELVVSTGASVARLIAPADAGRNEGGTNE